MRASESICYLFLTLFILLALIRPLAIRMRLRVIGLGIAGILILRFGALHPLLRDWIPALIMLLVYWQGGSFFTAPNQKLQTYLERFDKRFFTKWPGFLVRSGRPNSLLYLEIAYFFCYPLVPGAIVALYFLNLRDAVDFFWTVVLPPTLLCHLVVSFYQTYPPWKFDSLNSHGAVRKLNFIVIRHASIQLNTFPSGHVAASMAIALAMLHLDWIAGIVFLFLAIAIAASTVIGRYHYVADAVLGFFLAVCWYGIAAIL